MLPDFYSHVAYSFYLACVLVGDFNLLYVCWKLNTTEESQSRRFLECVEPGSEPSKGWCPAKPAGYKKELVGGVVVRGHLGYSDHEMVELSISIADIRKGSTKPLP